VYSCTVVPSGSVPNVSSLIFAAFATSVEFSDSSVLLLWRQAVRQIINISTSVLPITKRFIGRYWVHEKLGTKRQHDVFWLMA
jgi:hypothetical protein